MPLRSQAGFDGVAVQLRACPSALLTSNISDLEPRSERVFVVTGPSGAGKGTMVEALLERIPKLRLAVSATTRARRPSEQHGVHYLFLSDEEFDQRLAADDFVEHHVFPWGQRSGTLRSELDRIVAEGGVPLLELELNGAAAVKRKEPRAVTIFVDAPLSELERRLCERATESEGEIEERIALARKQKERAGEFDYVVENDDRERAADECVAIVERELARNATEQHALGVSATDGRAGQARTP
jgi:guanylate kinase